MLGKQPTANAQIVYTSRYSYLTQVSSGQLSLNQVNPLNPSENLAPLSITISSDLTVIGANSSEDGKWITLWSSNQSNLILHLYNVNNGTLTTVIQTARYEIDDIHKVLPIWSPNSQYFAFKIFNGNLPITYLFSISTQTLVTAQTGTSIEALPYIRPNLIEWSLDSSRFAIVDIDCYNLLCTNDINILNVPTLAQISNIKIDAGEICNLSWSSNNLSLSFIQDCSSPTAEYISDVFIWNIGQPQINRLTVLTSPSINPVIWTQTYSTRLDAIWYDSNNLLVGTASLKRASTPSTYIAETALYNTSTGRIMKLADEVAYGWVRNPISGEYTYRSASVSSVDDIAFNFTAGNVRIASFNGTNLTPSVQGTNPPFTGQSLSWSPDGRIVADFTLNPKGYIFLDKISGNSTQYILPNPAYITVGWISIQQSVFLSGNRELLSVEK